MTRPRTLAGRLALAGMVAALGAVLLLTVAFAFLLQRRLHAEAENVLRSRADAAIATVTVRQDGTLQITDTDHDRDLDAGIWVFQSQQVLDRPAGSHALQARARSLIGTSGALLTTQHSPVTEYYSEAVSSHGRQVGTVVAAISLEPYRRAFRVTVVSAALLGAVLTVLVYLVARLVAVRALQPVAEMSRQAGEWSSGDTSLRFRREKRPRELEQLAGNLDAMLDRLSAVLRRERQLSAEISHELRTPLAGIAAEAELFGSRPRTAQQAEAAMSTIIHGVHRMERILDTLLTAARVEGPSARGHCDPVAVAQETTVPVTVDGEVPWVGVDAPVLERVLSPVLENARRYADGRVSIHVTADSGGVQLAVLDDGPGIPIGCEEIAFDPGTRLHPDDGHDGAGLGLALARRLARAAGGDLTCQAGPGGHFVITLPRG